MRENRKKRTIIHSKQTFLNDKATFFLDFNGIVQKINYLCSLKNQKKVCESYNHHHIAEYRNTGNTLSDRKSIIHSQCAYPQPATDELCIHEHHP